MSLFLVIWMFAVVDSRYFAKNKFLGSQEKVWHDVVSSGKTKPIFSNNEIWFDFVLPNQALKQLIWIWWGKVTLVGHLYPLINKAKKNQIKFYT